MSDNNNARGRIRLGEPEKEVPYRQRSWQQGMDAVGGRFVRLEAQPVKAPYRGRAGHPLYGWS